MDRCDGNFHIRGHDAPVTIARHRAGKLDVQVEQGEVKLELVDRDPELLQVGVVSEGGDVTLRIDTKVDTDFALRSDSGAIDAPLDAVPVEEGDAAMQVNGRIGDGGGRVVVRAWNGQVRMLPFSE